jgi:hypothetical protein
MLLLKLVRELELSRWRHVRHLLLQRIESIGRRQMLGWRDHSHIDILLVCSLYLLLLLL